MPLWLEWLKCVRALYTFVADGLKVAKEGKKMPAVKCLHQESQNNTKDEYIMGHSFQVISFLVTAATGQVVAVPLLSRICEGLKRSGPRLSLLDKLASMFLELTRIAGVPSVLVADAYYASRKVIQPLVALGHHLISSLRWSLGPSHETARQVTTQAAQPETTRRWYPRATETVGRGLQSTQPTGASNEAFVESSELQLLPGLRRPW